MPGRFNRFAKRIFIILNIVVVIPYLLVCLVPFLDAGKFWFIALLGLVFPVLLFFVFAFFIVWLFARSRWAFLSLIAMLVSWQQLSVVFSLHPGKFVISKDSSTIRVFSWNVERWDEPNKERRGGTSYRGKMLDLVEKYNADILCFQEFFESKSSKHYESNYPVLESMGYRYHYFFPSASRFDGLFQSGVTILSKHPMIDSGQLSYGKKSAAERLIYADIKVNDQVIRVFTSHLESVLFQPKDYRNLSQIRNADDSALLASKNIIIKLKRAYRFRSEQAKIIRQHINDSPYPVIICGDFNDIPNSYTYFKIKGNLNDAFLKKGFGIGRTFRRLSPTLRIDYIFADEKFEITQFTRLKVPYSVHYPILTDLELFKD